MDSVQYARAMYPANLNSVSSSVLVDATAWLRDIILGTVGTTVAILAVAAIGLLMLSGRTPVRRGVTMIIGCFILFSAGAVADGLLVTAQDQQDVASVLPVTSQPVYTPAVPKAEVYDPYAGASVPNRDTRPIIQ